MHYYIYIINLCHTLSDAILFNLQQCADVQHVCWDYNMQACVAHTDKYSVVSTDSQVSPSVNTQKKTDKWFRAQFVIKCPYMVNTPNSQLMKLWRGLDCLVKPVCWPDKMRNNDAICRNNWGISCHFISKWFSRSWIYVYNSCVHTPGYICHVMTTLSEQVALFGAVGPFTILCGVKSPPHCRKTYSRIEHW